MYGAAGGEAAGRADKHLFVRVPELRQPGAGGFPGERDDAVGAGVLQLRQAFRDRVPGRLGERAGLAV